MRLDGTKVKRILVISLSNIGDAVLTTPVIQELRDNFPQAHLAVLMGPRAFSVFQHDRRIDRKIIYDKGISWKDKLRLIRGLKKERYDLVVDLRQTVLGIFLGTKYRTPILARAPESLTHMKDRHLWKLKSLGLRVNDSQGPSVEFSAEEEERVNRLWDKWQRESLPLCRAAVKKGQIAVAIACGARNMTKRWVQEGYRELIQRLIKEYAGLKVVMVGDEQDRQMVEEIIARISPPPLNFCGQTSIGELAFLLSKCRLLVSSDSAPMHLAWAVNTPVVAIFGPTDFRKYAPRGPKDVVIRKDLPCSPCEQSLCPRRTRECMQSITAEQVFTACRRILDEAEEPSS